MSVSAPDTTHTVFTEIPVFFFYRASRLNTALKWLSLTYSHKKYEMKQLLCCIVRAEPFLLNCLAIPCHRLKGMGRGEGNLFPNSPSYPMSCIICLVPLQENFFFSFFSKSFSHFSEALKLLKTVLRKSWQALRIGVCCNVCLPCNEHIQ